MHFGRFFQPKAPGMSEGEINGGSAMELGNAAQDVIPARKAPVLASHIEIFLFGFMILGKGLSLWHIALAVGYWKFYFIVGVVCLAYLCLMSSLAEMTSVLPFSGGSYGFVRCVLGPFLGFIAGIFESLEYAMFLATCVEIFGAMMRFTIGTRESAEAVYWLVFYGAALPVLVWGGKLIYRVGALLGLYSLGLFFIFMFGNVKEAEMTDDREFSKYEESPQTVELFFVCLIFVAWLFEGIEVITLTCDATSEPARKMPRTMMASVCTIVLVVMGASTIFGSIWPGPIWLAFFPFPLTFGLADALNCTLMEALIVHVPSLFAAGYLFLFAVSKQMHAMANSGLLPPILRRTFGPNQSPIYAMGAAIIVANIVQCSLYFNDSDTYITNLFAICLFSSLPVYILLMVSYLIFARKFTHLRRSFRSPMGSLGALFAIATFGAIFFVFLINMAEDVVLTTIFFIIFAVCIIVYYFWVAQERQCFSPDEQLRFFRVYVANASRMRRRIHAPLKFRRGWRAAVMRAFVRASSTKVFPSGSSSSDDNRQMHAYPGFTPLTKPRFNPNSNNSSTEEDSTDRQARNIAVDSRMLAATTSVSDRPREDVLQIYATAAAGPIDGAEGGPFLAEEPLDEERTVQFR